MLMHGLVGKSPAVPAPVGGVSVMYASSKSGVNSLQARMELDGDKCKFDMFRVRIQAYLPVLIQC